MLNIIYIYIYMICIHINVTKTLPVRTPAGDGPEEEPDGPAGAFLLCGLMLIHDCC